MRPNAHRGTSGYKVGMSIIGKEQQAGKPNGTDPANQSGGDTSSGDLLSGFHDLSVKNAKNGFVVRHTPKLPDGVKPYDEKAPMEQEHVFRNAVEAHHHIGTLLGVKMAAGDHDV